MTADAPITLDTLQNDIVMLSRNLRAQESGFTKLVNDVSKDFETLRTEVHNYADDWTRRIENMESEVDPNSIRQELTILLALFNKNSK